MVEGQEVVVEGEAAEAEVAISNYYHRKHSPRAQAGEAKIPFPACFKSKKSVNSFIFTLVTSRSQ